MTDATTEVKSPVPQLLNAETAYADTSDATSAELVTLATVTAKGNYDAAVAAANEVVTIATEWSTLHTYTADTTAIDRSNHSNC